MGSQHREASARTCLDGAQPGPDHSDVAAVERLSFADLEMDLAEHRVRRGGRPVRLGPIEFRLLRHLIERPRRVFSRERLVEEVWTPERAVDPRTVDVTIRRLRRALNADGGGELIRTVRQAGYALDDSPD